MSDESIMLDSTLRFIVKRAFWLILLFAAMYHGKDIAIDYMTKHIVTVEHFSNIRTTCNDGKCITTTMQ